MPQPCTLHHTLRASLLSWALLLPCVAIAQTPAPAADSAKDPWMTTEQLRKCVSLEIDKDLLDDEMARRKRAMDYADERVVNSARALEQGRSELDRSNPRVLAGFNEQVAAHNALIAEADAKVDAFNEVVRAYNAALSAFNGPCAGVRYKPRDWWFEKQRQMEARKQRPAA